MIEEVERCPTGDGISVWGAASLNNASCGGDVVSMARDVECAAILQPATMGF
jgi:hypothetical protein